MFIRRVFVQNERIRQKKYRFVSWTEILFVKIDRF